jgi:hypothetical protein
LSRNDEKKIAFIGWIDDWRYDIKNKMIVCQIILHIFITPIIVCLEKELKINGIFNL